MIGNKFVAICSTGRRVWKNTTVLWMKNSFFNNFSIIYERASANSLQIYVLKWKYVARLILCKHPPISHTQKLYSHEWKLSIVINNRFYILCAIKLLLSVLDYIIQFQLWYYVLLIVLSNFDKPFNNDINSRGQENISFAYISKFINHLKGERTLQYVNANISYQFFHFHFLQNVYSWPKSNLNILETDIEIWRPFKVQ